MWWGVIQGHLTWTQYSAMTPSRTAGWTPAAWCTVAVTLALLPFDPWGSRRVLILQERQKFVCISFIYSPFIFGTAFLRRSLQLCGYWSRWGKKESTVHCCVLGFKEAEAVDPDDVWAKKLIQSCTGSARDWTALNGRRRQSLWGFLGGICLW